MKKIIAAAVAAIMVALFCTGCLFEDPLVVSTRYASKFCGEWEDENKNRIRVGKDDDTIGYIDCDAASGMVAGDWKMKNTTLVIYWHPSELFNQAGAEKDEDITISYTYADSLNDDIIEQGKDAVQKYFENKKYTHLWYVSDKYLCLDGLVFTDVKE